METLVLVCLCVVGPIVIVFLIFSPVILSPNVPSAHVFKCDGSTHGDDGTYYQCGARCYRVPRDVKSGTDLARRCRLLNSRLVPAVPRSLSEYACVENLTELASSYGMWLGVCEHFASTYTADSSKHWSPYKMRHIHQSYFAGLLVYLFYDKIRDRYSMNGVGLQGTDKQADGLCQIASVEERRRLDELVFSNSTYCWRTLYSTIKL